ncbi:MAG: hypothetical protein E6G22_06750 [Actinobacteria bacterium]|nr:MAG: hypothetical protein E6G42_01170 [Actinomycetota bacterium]TML63192.1 MAG: hypothetical protein E6G22_06750 [Actinomycetota bacterium]
MADGATSAGRSRQAPIRIGAVVALALAIAFVVWLVVRGNDNTSSTAKTSTTHKPGKKTPKPRETIKAASPQTLRALAQASGHPIYWAGPQPKVKYELTQVTDGRIYIRYLPKGVPIGDRRAAYLIVATYPVKDAYKAVRTAAKESGAVTFHTSRGGLAVYNQSAATNVYLAYPGSKFQVEVFDPNPSRARQLVRSGTVRPIA